MPKVKQPERDLSGLNQKVLEISGRSRGYIEISCPTCSAKRLVRADYAKTKPGYCRKCTGVMGRIVSGPRKKLGTDKNCTQCGKEFYAHKYDSERLFCSKECFDESRRKYPIETRICLLCEKEFTGRDRPHSNSTGKYCSVNCKRIHIANLLRKNFGPKTRPGWRVARNNFIKENNFCVRCGREDGRLVVHHIIPNRVSQNHDRGNLITLCQKCHSAVEPSSDMILSLPENIRSAAVAVLRSNFSDNWHVFQGRRIEREATEKDCCRARSD